MQDNLNSTVLVSSHRLHCGLFAAILPHQDALRWSHHHRHGNNSPETPCRLQHACSPPRAFLQPSPYLSSLLLLHVFPVFLPHAGPTISTLPPGRLHIRGREGIYSPLYGPIDEDGCPISHKCRPACHTLSIPGPHSSPHQSNNCFTLTHLHPGCPDPTDPRSPFFIQLCLKDV